MSTTASLETPIELDQLTSGVFYKVNEILDKEMELETGPNRTKAANAAKRFFTRRYCKVPFKHQNQLNKNKNADQKEEEDWDSHSTAAGADTQNPTNTNNDDKENAPNVNVDNTETEGVEFLVNYNDIAANFHNVREDGSIKKKIRRHGNGIKPTHYAKMYVHYAMFTEGNDEPLYATGTKPLAFYSFQENIMTWLDSCVAEMEVGEISYFLVAAKHGYGGPGITDLIPPESTLLFEVELCKFIESPKSLKLPELPVDKLNEEPFTEIEKYIKFLKEDALNSIKALDYWQALDKYRKGIFVLENYFNFTKDEDSKKKNLFLFECHRNAAACLLKTEDYDDVLFSCNVCLDLAKHLDQCKLIKVYFRMASAEYELGHFKKAKKYIMLAKEEEPLNKEVVLLLAKIKEQLKLEETAENALYKKMANAFL